MSSRKRLHQEVKRLRDENARLKAHAELLDGVISLRLKAQENERKGLYRNVRGFYS